MKNIFILLVFIIGVVSCEKVIDIPLNEADKKVVIEAVCNDRAGESKILLSKSGSIYEESVFEKINDAVITITDKNGIVTTFIEDGTSTGVYGHPAFETEPDQVYSLSVTIGEEVYTATSVTKTFVPLSLVYYQKEPSSPFIQTDNDSVYTVSFAYTDNAIDENYYRIKVTKNGVLDSYLYVIDDKLYNGEDYIQPLFANAFDQGDICFLEFLNMDKANYTYFTSKEAGSDGSATPANPVSNIEGGALGYFGAYLTDTVTVILP
tara:strand:- start:386 stop:1177 length:792 start_codon:yes stop_codon:yes gene_type:complete